jgi:hypothetical protein
LSQSLNSLSEEKEHLLRVLSEKESSVEEERREKLELLREVAEKEHIEQLMEEKERKNLELSSQIDSLNEMNYNLQKIPKRLLIENLNLTPELVKWKENSKM